MLRPAVVWVLPLLLARFPAVPLAEALDDKRQGQTGFFLVLAEGLAAKHLAEPTKDQQVVRFDYEFLRDDERRPARYLLLASRPDVPLALAKPPETKVGTEGRTELLLELTDGAAARLANVTSDNVGNQVAFMLDGKVVSTHTIREAIAGGHFKLSRCTDNACELIYARLVER